MDRDKEYTTYSFEDFLQDDYFISSTVNPDEESIAFWENYLKSKPESIDEFLAARLYIESFPINKGALSEEEIHSLWNSIAQSNSEFETFSRKRKYGYIAMITLAAACIIGVIFVPSFFNIPANKGLDIYDFAQNTPVANYQLPNVQLIMSDNKTILLDDDEYEVEYNPTGIKTNGKDFSKKEAAPYNQLIVPKGKHSTLTLADGTRVWVNAGTRVIYPVEFGKKERELYVDGEIYIEVTSNKEWPFVVRTRDIGISVLGTAFNVTAHESDAVKRVVLASGSIEITHRNCPDKECIVLLPDRKYEYSDNAGFIETVDAAKFISWKDGLYLFENECLGVIIEHLSHYYSVDITADTESAELKCSGKLDLRGDIDDVLLGLTYTVSVQYEKLQNQYAVKYSP